MEFGFASCSQVGWIFSVECTGFVLVVLFLCGGRFTEYHVFNAKREYATGWEVM